VGAGPASVQAHATGVPVTTPIALSPVAPGRPLHALTVDVEDWYQSCIDYDAPITERVIRNVERLLAVLDECGVKATFFFQGLVAETFPQLVQTVLAEGHEVQAHGYSHRPLFAMDERALREEVERSRETVEAAAGTPVTAFRAQDFSILQENLWALDVIADAGFTVDSSIFPLKARRYGIEGWEVGPHRVALSDGRTLIEVPVAVRGSGRWRLPVAGGGYFRALPFPVLDRSLRAIAAAGRPAIVYCHPYEFNPTELDEFRGRAPARVLRSQGLGRRRFVARLRRLLGSHPFGRFDDVLAAWGVTPEPVTPRR
jgi:polysaccharide deacetylase family protein (PEP-CTERM system associated)